MASESMDHKREAERFTLADLDYDLPEGLIAQRPTERRGESRMMTLDRSSGQLADRAVQDLPSLLRAGDLLVLNDTKVIPAKFHAVRQSGGRIEGLFLAEEKPQLWRVMLRGSRRLKRDETLNFGRANDPSFDFTLIEDCGDGQWLARAHAGQSPEFILNQVGQTPLPPYIKRQETDPTIDADDRKRYQTVYARQVGSVAAPTAGLHFTNALLEDIRQRGVEIANVTLHVGIGTFKPIKVEQLDKHPMHAEQYEISPETAEAIARCRARDGRVVAVGTTAVRTLEAAHCDEPRGRCVQPTSSSTDLFLFPGRPIRIVDALLTNFHLPRSTLLALVMTFAGVEFTRRAYRHAIESAYRFYSYGDAMFIH